MKKPVTWILVADGSRARVFQSLGRGRIEQKRETVVAHPPSREIMSDRPGRTFDSAGLGRHAKEPPSDAHDKAEVEFLRSVTQQLDVSHKNKEFDRLVLVAPPRALGTLRSVFPKPLSDAVMREIDHDLTGFKTPDLETYLHDRGVI